MTVTAEQYFTLAACPAELVHLSASIDAAHVTSTNANVKGLRLRGEVHLILHHKHLCMDADQTNASQVDHAAPS